MIHLNHRLFYGKAALFMLISLFFSACSPSETEKAENKKYFDLKTLVAETAADLQKKKALKESEVLLNETAAVSADREVNWERELRLFADADINMPALRDAYSSREEGNTLIYTASDDKAKVRRLSVEKENGRPVRLEIEYRTENVFFVGERRLSLLYGPESLKEYRLEGYRKMLLRDSLHFRSLVKIKIP